MTKGILLDPIFGAIENETGVDDSLVWEALEQQQPEMAQMAREMARWSADTRRSGGLFERDRYVTPGKIFDQMRTAYDASESDDIVSGVAEMTESLAFQKTYLIVEDEDEEDVWNQITADIELDSRIREMWKELFTVSQFYVATWWGTKSYRVRGKNKKSGTKRKREFRDLRVPIGLTILDPLKIVPVGNFMFGQEQLAYAAHRDEAEQFMTILKDRNGTDEIIEELFVGEYKPSLAEARKLSDMGIESRNLFLLNPAVVWKHTLTKPQYKRFAEVRMKAVFELLDMKHQLRAMDRAYLIGGTNFILLVKKGSDKEPAKPAEIANLQANVRMMARVPVIVGDNRLSIEIITPDQDHTLRPDRYNAIDARLAARMWQMFFIGNFQAGGRTDNSGDLVRVVARSMEARRHMLRRSIEKHVLDQTYERNREQFDEAPKLRFSPKQIALSFDPVQAQYLMDLRDRGEISRETLLAHIDLAQNEEALRREREVDRYDDIFQTTVPFAAPGQNPTGPATSPKTAGRTQGGNKSGGGASGAAAKEKKGTAQNASDDDEG